MKISFKQIPAIIVLVTLFAMPAISADDEKVAHNPINAHPLMRTFELAFKRRDLPLIEGILNTGFNPNVKMRESNESCLCHAIITPSVPNTDGLVKLLLTYGVTIDNEVLRATKQRYVDYPRYLDCFGVGIDNIFEVTRLVVEHDPKLSIEDFQSVLAEIKKRSKEDESIFIDMITKASSPEARENARILRENTKKMVMESMKDEKKVLHSQYRILKEYENTTRRMLEELDQKHNKFVAALEGRDRELSQQLYAAYGRPIGELFKEELAIFGELQLHIQEGKSKKSSILLSIEGKPLLFPERWFSYPDLPARDSYWELYYEIEAGHMSLQEIGEEIRRVESEIRNLPSPAVTSLCALM